MGCVKSAVAKRRRARIEYHQHRSFESPALDILHIIVLVIVGAMLISPAVAVVGGWWWISEGSSRFPLSQWSGFTILCFLVAVGAVLVELIVGVRSMHIGAMAMVGMTVGLFGLAVRRGVPVDGARRNFLAAGGLLISGVLTLVVGASLNVGIGAGFRVEERLAGELCLKVGERNDIEFVLKAMLCLATAFMLDMRFRKNLRAAVGGLSVFAVIFASILAISQVKACGPVDVSNTMAGHDAAHYLGNGGIK